MNYYKAKKNFINTFDNWLRVLIFFSIIGVNFFLIYLLNINTHLTADDFCYSFINNSNTRVSNILDIINSQITHYFNWGGRSVVHFLAQLFLLIGKPIFNIINSIAYIAFILLIYHHRNNIKSYNSILFVFINLLVWFFIPTFGQTILWLTGSCNYLWGSLLILCMLVIYRKHYIKKCVKDNIINCILIFLLGILAGWTNENTAAGMIVIIISYLFLYKRNYYVIPKWSIIGLIGSIIGFVVMILAPGNFIRADYFKQEGSMLEIYLDRLNEITLDGMNHLLPLIFIIIVLISFNIYFKINISDSIIYVIGGIVAMYSMILSPIFPDRAWFGIVVYFIISICILYANLDLNHELIKTMSLLILITSLILFFYDYKNTYHDISSSYNQCIKREQYILEQKKLGNLDIICNKIEIKTKDGTFNDINKDKEYWINSAVANYYDLNSIIAK